HPEKHIPEAQMRRYELFLQRREGGECAAYVIGYKEFRRLKLHVTADTLVPRADTETLVEAVLDYVDGKTPPPRSLHVLDLCTGSGAVALALKQERPFLNVYASDISEAALHAAKQNAAEHSLDVHFIQSDLFQNIGGVFDILTANPPYIPSAAIGGLAPEVRREPALALDGGPDGLVLIRAIVQQAGAYLSPGGALFMETAPEQINDTAALLTSAGFTRITRHNDLAGDERVIGASWYVCKNYRAVVSEPASWRIFPNASSTVPKSMDAPAIRMLLSTPMTSAKN
ncbi:MAG: peptide chain release factor N(5)-glutamine methyltransferase, partial [Spirochaetaceae bacterium]|nr:peptide chain release factor N(5)-glutamine methyltransferase [Spirochaetaceae bacterium]